MNTILCWSLAISLVWLPFSVSALTSLSQTDSNSHEMHSVMPVHAVDDDPVNKSIVQKESCDCCDDGCSCEETTVCSSRINHTQSFIKIDIHFFKFIQFSQSMIETSVELHSQIIPPGIRPPII